MPYINYLETDDNYNYYKPSESLQNLFENVVITPLRGSLPGVASNPNAYTNRKLFWIKEERIHIRIILHKIRYYFIVSIICLCISISYHFYRHIPLIGINNVVFIDFGCGPLTSGVAFWAAAGERNITYIGIDRAQSMLTKACEINGYHPEFEGPFYPDVGFYLINDLQLPIASINGYKYYQLLQMLHNILMLNLWNSDDTLIIFNFWQVNRSQ